MLELVLNIALAVAILVLIGMYLFWRATRLDRLHSRVEMARAGLDAALVRRTAVSLELATSRLLDPAASLLLATAAHEARTADAERREFAESDLSRALRAVVEQPDFRATLSAQDGGAELLDELDSAAQKVAFARSFHNNVVSVTLTARRKLINRAFSLAGHAAPPEYFEIDDAAPAT